MIRNESAMHRKTTRRIILLVAFATLLILMAWGNQFFESIDRHKVTHFRYRPGMDVTEGVGHGNTNSLRLPNGECVTVGKDVFCYAESRSHHGLAGFKHAYSYVNVNGVTFRQPGGPCSSCAIIPLDEIPASEVTESMLIEKMRCLGYQELTIAKNR